MLNSKHQSPSRSVRPAISLIVSFLACAPLAISQGVPRLSVNPSAYHTLVAPGTLVTAAMCRQGDSFCLTHAVGNPLFSSNESYATGPLGDIYIADSSYEIIIKVTPTGQPTIVAGEYGVTATGDAPLTAPASTTTFDRLTSITVDHQGNVYVGSGPSGSTAVLKLDSSGTVHRLTATSATATKAPVEGALALTQFVSPNSLGTNAAGDLYISDGFTSTVRVLSARTEDLNTVVGCLAAGCSKSSTPVAGEKATLFNLPSSIAVGNDGTIYLFNIQGYSNSNLYLYSVTTDGIFHVLAGNANLNFNQATGPQAGPVATVGDIGIPYGQLAVDPAGDVYFAATGITYSSYADTMYSSNLVEVTKGTAASPSQVLILSTGPASAEGGIIGEGDYINTLNPEGMPSTLTLDLPLALALDPFGRIVMPTQNAADQNLSENLYAPGPEAIGVAYFDRNGAVIIDNPAPQYGVSAAQQIVTLTNSGSAALRTLNIGGTSYPYYLQPTAAEIESDGGSGAPTFSIDTKVGTCLPLYEKTGVLTLQPGESCTLAFDYTPNPTVPQAGVFTLYTNDPLGPLTVTLAATTVVSTSVFDQFLIQFATYNGLSVSSTVLTPNSPVSTNGEFTVHAAVASSIYDPSNPLAVQGYGYLALSDYPVVPTGRISAAVSNNTTGKVTSAPEMTLDADGNATFTFSGLPPGTYSLEAVYLGDGKSKASFSNIETLVVLPKS